MTVWATRADQVDLRGPNPHDLARSQTEPPVGPPSHVGVVRDLCAGGHYRDARSRPWTRPVSRFRPLYSKEFYGGARWTRTEHASDCRQRGPRSRSCSGTSKRLDNRIGRRRTRPETAPTERNR